MIRTKFILNSYKYFLWEKIYWTILKLKTKKRLYNLWMENKNIINPPSFIKEKIIKMYAKKFSTKVLIETGTGKGDMIKAMRKEFKSIHSIELDKALYEYAKGRFSKYNHINLYYGDSSKILPTVLFKVKKPCIFWLDAHYSGGITAKGDLNTPIIKELDSIISESDFTYVILIDDARDFIGENDYPTLVELKQFVLSKNPKLRIIVKEDIIRITAKNG